MASGPLPPSLTCANEGHNHSLHFAGGLRAGSSLTGPEYDFLLGKGLIQRHQAGPGFCMNEIFLGP